MILSLKKDVRKQVKQVNKEVEKLCKKFDKKEYDTNKDGPDRKRTEDPPGNGQPRKRAGLHREDGRHSPQEILKACSARFCRPRHEPPSSLLLGMKHSNFY